MQPVAPCKDCPDRHHNCHSRCPKYKKFKEDMKEFNKILKKEIEKSYPRFKRFDE